MPSTEQNVLVQKYCAVCHTDAANNGGLSLQHFDAAQAPPSLTAMLLSKLTGGVSLDTLNQARLNPAAAEFVETKVKSGAMGAAGIPVPDKATVEAFIQALAMGSAGATEWAIRRTKASAATNTVIEASILREKPAAAGSGEARAYRVTLACNVATQHGSLQVAWSPLPWRGTLAASVDGRAAVRYRVDGSEKMGNGSLVVTRGIAALVLTDTKYAEDAGLPLPAETLTIADLFPDETVVFPFAELPRDARREFEACFSGIGRLKL